EAVMGLVDRDDGWRRPDWLWQRIEPLLPERPTQPLGCHNPRVPDRDALDAILLLLRSGIQWNTLNATGSVPPARPTAASGSGSGPASWRQGLLVYDERAGIAWEWLAMEGALPKAPPGRAKTGSN